MRRDENDRLKEPYLPKLFLCFPLCEPHKSSNPCLYGVLEPRYCSVPIDRFQGSAIFTARLSGRFGVADSVIYAPPSFLCARIDWRSSISPAISNQLAALDEP